jgi:chloride channel protein, CIC family
LKRKAIETFAEVSTCDGKTTPRVVVGEKMPLEQLLVVVANFQQIYFPAINQDGKVIGILSTNDIREVMFEQGVHHLIVAKDIATPNVVRFSGRIHCRRPWIK